MVDSDANSESRRFTDPTASGRLNKLDASEGAEGDVTTTRRRLRRQRMPGLAMLPTALTLGNAVAGVAALIELTKAYHAEMTGDTSEFYVRMSYAALLIGAGMVFDALDGKVARMTSTTGRFGAELDSLCDAVTFGVVPALMIRVGGEFFFSGYDFDSKILWGVCGLFACCAILRLARYNVETDDESDHNSFRGLPSPAAAACIAGMFLGLTWLHEHVDAFAGQPWPWILRVFIPVTAAFVGLMMLTRFRYIHLFNRFVTRRQSLRTMIVFLVVVMFVVIFSSYWRLMVPVAMLAYALSGPVYFTYRFVRGRGLLGRRQVLAERKRQRLEQKP